MNPTLTVIVLLGITTYALKALGPVVLHSGRALPSKVDDIARLLPAPLLAALVTLSTAAQGGTWILDARLAGLAAAAAALRKKLPFVVVLAVAAVTTASVRMACSAMA